ncbi:EPS biosynthesis protein [Herbaspirillum lusitanum]|uniref:EPS biosynthesis protein n=1 Tax=Herbaspirillum lusitanum TaxID=213312 RepID=A0ABW9A5D2_9BURK
MAFRFQSGFSHRFGAPLFTALALSSLQPAFAADDDQVVVPYAQYSILYDDNLLRLQNAAAAQASLGTEKMSDTVHTTVGGLRINKELGRQRIRLDASLNKNAFDYFKQFDNSGRDLKANWSWVVGDYFSGDAGYAYSQALTPFQNLRVLQKNLRTLETKYLSAAWRLHPDWTVRAQGSRFGLGYDLPSQQSNTFTQDTAEVGVDYTARSGSTVGLVARHTKANYPFDTVISGTQINNSFKQDELKAKVLWLYSGKTRLQFLGGYATRERQSSGAADYSGFNARLIADWAATGKTLFTVNLWREIGGLSDVDANYALTNGLSLAGTLKASDKLRFDGLIDYEKRNYNGATVITGVTPSSRQDKYEKASFSVTYSPLKPLSLVASIFRETLQSNIDNFGYTSNGVAVTSRYEF